MTVLAEFAASWSLFAESYLVGMISAVLLALLGVWVVGRRQVFLGAAIAQASGCGVAIALALQLVLGFDSDGMQALVPLLAATSGGVVGFLASDRFKGRFDEGRVAWIFLVGASGSVLFVAHHPEGLEIIHRLLFSTMLGSTWNDVAILAILALCIGGLAFRFRERLVLLILDTDASALAGVPVHRWTLVISVGLGVSVGLVMQATGFLYTFGYLVLPVLAAREFCREVRQILWVAPALALAVVLPSFAVAYGLDLPPSQVAVAGLAALVLAGWVAD